MGSKLARNYATQEDLEKLGVLDAELFDSTLVALPLVAPQLVDGVAITDQDRVLFTNLADASKNNRIHQAAIAGLVISWTQISTAELGDDQKVLIDKGASEENNFKQIQGGVWKTANEGVNPAAGEANTNSNAGTGAGKIAKAKVGVDTPLKSIKAGANITVTNNADDITISGPGAGEVNTSSNAGAGGGGFADLAKAKAGVNLPFRRLKAGANITLTQNADDIEIIAAALGGSGFTKITNSAQLTGTIEGDVLVDGGSVIQTNLVIKGNLFLANNIAGNGLQKITVWGSVYNVTSASRFISMDGAVDGQKGGDIEIYGNCHSVSLQCKGGGSSLGAGIAGIGGNIRVLGNFHYDPVNVLGQLVVDGGLTGDINVNGADAGTIYIGGDAIVSGLSAQGAAMTVTGIAGVTFAGNGGQIEILGNCYAKGAIVYRGGTGGNRTSGGDGGEFRVRGTLICEDDIDAHGGENGHADAGIFTGKGGLLQVEGDCYFKKAGAFSYKFNGGVFNSSVAQGNAKDGGQILVEGNLIAEGDIYMMGGVARNAGTNGIGGILKVEGHVRCTGKITLSGGTTVTNPSTAAAVRWGAGSYIKGGCNITEIEAEDSDGIGTPPGLHVFSISGNCTFGIIRFENRTQTQVRSVQNQHTSFHAGNFSPKNTLVSSSGTLSGVYINNYLAFSERGVTWEKFNGAGIL